MSEIMLAVLRLPDNLFWKECPVARAQHNSIRKEAADRIAELEAENASLRFKLDDERDRRRKAEARLMELEKELSCE